MAKKVGGLGKGLSAIFIENDAENSNEAVTLRIADIEPNRDQPRKEFDEQALAELSQSIMQHGVLQPILVRPLPLKRKYQESYNQRPQASEPDIKKKR